MVEVDPIKILLVEDELLLVMSLRLLLEGDGRFHVTGHAARVAPALRCIEREVPDVALVDIRLAHGENGLDVADMLRRRGVPCLLMSGDPSDMLRRDIAIGCIAKPFGDDDLLAALAIVIALSRGEPVTCASPGTLILY